MTEPTLLPCPFCGSSPEMGEDEDGVCAVMCLNKNCYVTGPGREEAGNAISSWNRRAPAAAALDAAGARITGLEAMLTDAQAEVERLREALLAQKAADDASMTGPNDKGYDHWQELENKAKDLAAKAIGRTP